MRLCGLEPFVIEPTSVFANIGERCNVAGSILFKKLIVQNDWGKAAEIAQNQVESGAQLLGSLPASIIHQTSCLSSDFPHEAIAPHPFRCWLVASLLACSMCAPVCVCARPRSFVCSVNFDDGMLDGEDCMRYACMNAQTGHGICLVRICPLLSCVTSQANHCAYVRAQEILQLNRHRARDLQDPGCRGQFQV